MMSLRFHKISSKRRDRRLRDDCSGVSAVEFALVAPILLACTFGVLDFGIAAYAKYNIDNGVTAASNYALLSASSVSSSGGASLATKLASIVANARSSGWGNATVVVNNGPSVSIQSGVSSSSGTASNADSCYCPTRSGTTITWGSAMSCGSSCAGGSFAGKFVVINGSTSYTSVFGRYGLVSNTSMTSMAVLQVQ